MGINLGCSNIIFYIYMSVLSAQSPWLEVNTAMIFVQAISAVGISSSAPGDGRWPLPFDLAI
jgi:hypothetical protein